MEDRIKRMINREQSKKRDRWLKSKKGGSRDSKLGEYDYRGVRIR